MKITFTGLAFFLLLLENSTLAQINFTKIDSLLLVNEQKHIFSGHILIAENQKIVFQKMIGLADYKTQAAFSKQSKFQIASVSKQFTAFGIMLLQAKGLLKYDDKVQLHLPTFPYPNITVRQLLHHTSGLPEFWNKIRPKLNQKIQNGNQEMLQYLIENKLPLEFEPNSKMQYSDIGYDILAMIIEQKSGLSYEKFMDKNVFKPAGMKHTKALMVTDIRLIEDEKLAKGHSWIDSLQRYEHSHLLPSKDFVFYLGRFYGDGSVVATAHDLLKWDKALTQNLLLSESQMNEAYLPAKDNQNQVIYANPASKLNPNYGFGWSLANHPTLGRMYYHNGGHPGFVSYYLRCPDRNLTVVFLSNQDNTSALGDLRLSIMEQIYAGFNQFKPTNKSN
jgi:CubicO group peptidase (beta-lactamase class C family)